MSKNSAKKLGTVRRKSVGSSQQDWVMTGPLMEDKAIPFVIQPAVEGVNLGAWAQGNRVYVDELLLKHRALLFRNFNVQNVSDFEQFVMATSNGELLEYRDRTTPRTSEGNRIYTSTVYPSELRINPHNEGTYWTKWAMKIYFCCLKAPAQGGETPLTDVRNVYKHIDPEIRNKFIRKKWVLVRNFNDGFGLPWQDVFQTKDKAEVESYCHQNSIEFEWKDNDRLRTRQVRPAVRKHPKTGELVWFNHAVFYHDTTLEPTIREALLSEFGLDGLPYNTYYGDGTPIEPDVAEHIYQAYAREKVVFPWESGDVTLLDNMSVAHAREPFVGERKIIVSMTDAIDESACSIEEARDGE